LLEQEQQSKKDNKKIKEHATTLDTKTKTATT